MRSAAPRVLRHLRGRWGGEGVTGLRSRQISRSSGGLGLFPTGDNKRDPFPQDRGRARRCYLGQRDLSRVVKEKTGQFLL